MNATVRQRILVVDDEPQIRKILSISLDSDNYDVLEAYNGREGVRLTATRNPDLIVLDLGLPDIDGMLVIKEIREFSKTPIIVLSVRSDESDKVQALDLGASDYVTKPFNIRELLARIRSGLRDKILSESSQSTVTAGDIEFDFSKRIVTLKKKRIYLSPKEYYLLAFFIKNLGSVITHAQLLKEVWGPMCTQEHQYLRVYIRALRQKIEETPSQPKYIITESGVGYRMVNLSL